MILKKLIYIALFAATFYACKKDKTDDDDQQPSSTKLISGLTYGTSTKSFKAVDIATIVALAGVDPIKVIAQIEHRGNAITVDKQLDSTKVILFGNPALGTPLMQKNQLVGLDLPQKLLIFKDASDSTKVAFNNVSYLKARHDLGEIEALDNIEKALENFVNVSADGSLVETEASSVEKEEGIITKTSTKSFLDTYNSLVEAITNNENLKLVVELDHQANAAAVDLELMPTRLVIFGNPNLGTPLMQNQQTTGIDLPQKMLVWQDDEDVVKVSYNDPEYIKTRHGITKNEDVLNNITNALDNLSNAAAGL